MKEGPPSRQRLRRLSDEEIALWTEVARSVKRRRGAVLPTPSKPVVAEPPPAPPPMRAEAPASRLAKPSAPPLAPIDRRLKRKLKRGRGEIDGAIDLHGLTQAEAHQALRGFLRHSQARGSRLVIVVTGKGGPLDEQAGWPQERGVLQTADPALAARAGPALRRARLRGGGTRARRVGRALRAPAAGLTRGPPSALAGATPALVSGGAISSRGFHVFNGLRRHFRLSGFQAVCDCQAGSRPLAHCLSLFGLGARLQKSFRKLRSSVRGLQKAFNRLQKISFSFSESRIINGLRANGGQKNCRVRRGPDMGRAPPRPTVLTRESTFGARRPGQLHVPPSSIQILACRRVIDFEAGLRSRADASLRGERIVNVADPFVKKKVFFITPKLGARRFPHFPPPSCLKAPGAAGGQLRTRGRLGVTAVWPSGRLPPSLRPSDPATKRSPRARLQVIHHLRTLGTIATVSSNFVTAVRYRKCERLPMAAMALAAGGDEGAALSGPTADAISAKSDCPHLAQFNRTVSHRNTPVTRRVIAPLLP